MTRRFPPFFFIVFCATAILPFAFRSAPVLAAESNSQFSTVAPSDPLQTDLQTVRRAGWSNLGLSSAPTDAPTESTPVALTRYEMALETAKAVIAVRARHNADANWHRGVSLRSLSALRALCVAFKTELAGFDVNVPATLHLLDELLADSIKADTTKDTANSRAISQAGSTPNKPSALRLQPQRDDSQSDNVIQSLAQKLRIYSALDSLARQASDPFAGDTLATFSTGNHASANFGGVQRLRAGATFEVNPSLQLRAEFQNQDGSADAFRAPSLHDFLNCNATSLQSDPFAANARSIGAGVDLKLLGGMTVSGGVARVNELSSGGDALRYEGGVGFSGWQNRVALSAHLSRLVPEDSFALGATAARLNLGVGLTSQIQLKLMYQQMFGASAGLQTIPRFGGGLDFSF